MRWQWRRRGEIGELRAEVHQMQLRLDTLLDICRQAGVSVESGGVDAVAGVAPGLVAASRTAPLHGGESVVLTAPDGRQAIAVVSGQGDPQRWMAEIKQRAFA
jgi:hypothetical protein